MRIVLAEDEVLLREGLATLLSNAGHDVVATAGDLPDLTGRGSPAPRREPELKVVVLWR